jgi:hypothetical protein
MFACKKIMKFYAKSSIWTKLLLWIFVVFIIAGLMRKYTTVKEGFIQKETFILKEGPDIFDDFYVSIYDDLVFSQVKNKFEIGEIINTTKATEESRLLDIGTGAGHHYLHKRVLMPKVLIFLLLWSPARKSYILILNLYRGMLWISCCSQISPLHIFLLFTSLFIILKTNYDFFKIALIG